MAKVAPSVLEADFFKVSEWLSQLEKAKPDFIHFDIMDNKYVPNKGVDRKHLPELKALTSTPFDVHLMVETPEKELGFFLDNGVKRISFHAETAQNPGKVIEGLHSNNAEAGIAINHKESVESIERFLGEAEFFLVMTVEAGFGGQGFLQENIEKIRLLAGKRCELGLSFGIEVDGGINAETGARVVAAGADVLVAGSYVFKAKSIAEAVESLRKL